MADSESWQEEARSLASDFEWIHNTDDPARLRLAIVDLHSSLEHVLEGMVGEADPSFDRRAASFQELLRAAQQHTGLSEVLVEKLIWFHQLRDQVVHHRVVVTKADVESALDKIRICVKVLVRFGARESVDAQTKQRRRGLRERIGHAKDATEDNLLRLRIGKKAESMSFAEVAGIAMIGNIMISAILLVVLTALAILVIAMIWGWVLGGASSGGGAGGLIGHIIASLFGAALGVAALVSPVGIVAGIILAVVGGLVGLGNGFIMVVLFLLARIVSRHWWRFRIIPFGFALVVCAAFWAYLGASVSMGTWDVLNRVSFEGIQEMDKWVIAGSVVGGFLVTLVTELFLTSNRTDEVVP